MSIHIELQPEEEVVLLERARLIGRDLAGYVHQVLQEHILSGAQGGDRDDGAATAMPTSDALIDHEFVAYCEREGDEGVTLEDVLEATSKIKDSMARVIIEEERADRF